jgi:thymidylate synthase
MITNHPEQQYLDIGSEILSEGVYKPNRTGVGTYSLFGRQMRFNLQEGFPLLTTKQVAFKPMVNELLWFLKGSTDNNLLREMGAKIWDQWATEDGDLGPIYGKQWVDWEVPRTEEIEAALEQLIEDNQSTGVSLSGAELHKRLDDILDIVRIPKRINQIQEVIDALNENPNSRRILVTAWNPAVLPQEQEWEYRVFDLKNAEAAKENGWSYCGKDIDMGPDVDGDFYCKKRKLSPQDNVKRGKAALPACHTMFQFYTRPLPFEERVAYAKVKGFVVGEDPQGGTENAEQVLDTLMIPRHALSCQLYQRSADWPIGVPFNIVSYALLTEMVAQVTNMVADEFIWTGGDVHIYEDQAELFEEQLTREPRPFPVLRMNDSIDNIFEFEREDFVIAGYDSHLKIKYPVAT